MYVPSFCVWVCYDCDYDDYYEDDDDGNGGGNGDDGDDFDDVDDEVITMTLECRRKKNSPKKC